MPDLIRAIRRESIHSNTLIMVGGPIFSGDPKRAKDVGADLYAVDGASALLQVGKWLGVSRERVKAF
jgi:methanogenic corrinoid protein MtbC1